MLDLKVSLHSEPLSLYQERDFFRLFAGIQKVDMLAGE